MQKSVWNVPVIKAGLVMVTMAMCGLSTAGCSSSTTPGDGTSSGGAGTSGGTGSVCPKLTQANIQALLAMPISKIAEVDLASTLLDCSANGLDIQMNTQDGDKMLYLAGFGDGGDTHPISGIGDVAYWQAASKDGKGSTINSVPSLSAHKGSATCFLSTDNDPTKYAMLPTTSGLPFSIAPADALAWVQKAGVVCNEFFLVAGQ